jgi:predicted acylesterase/phospholipase RssA
LRSMSARLKLPTGLVEQFLGPIGTMHSMRTVLGPSCGPDRLEDAFRARSSVPVVLAPMQDGERVLVDGDVLDPVPAKTVRDIGADLCLAINVVTPPRTGVQIMLSRSTGSSTH